MNEWQPIENLVPQEGVTYILYSTEWEEMTMAELDSSEEGYPTWWYSNNMLTVYRCTHFFALPDPPKDGNNDD